MKKYVLDFAKDEMKCCSNRRKSEIQAILENYKNDVITAIEAVKAICDTYYERL